MRIEIDKYTHTYRRYNTKEHLYTQEQFDYMFKYLDFDKFDKNWYIYFNDKETSEWFYKTHINTDYLKDIYNDSPEGYEWLKENWGKGIFKIVIYYLDKQELKTIVNKIINIELIMNK